MIIRDENGRAISAEKIADITAEMSDLEKYIKTAAENKRNGGSLNDEEREALNNRVEDLKMLIENIDDDTKRRASAFELLSFIKQITKFKKLVEDLKKAVSHD